MSIRPWILALLLLPSALLAHVPVALDKAPKAVMDAARNRNHGMDITEAAVNVGHSEVPLEDLVMIYVLKGKTPDGKDIAVEITADGLVLQTWDREYYEEYVED